MANEGIDDRVERQSSGQYSSGRISHIGDWLTVLYNTAREMQRRAMTDKQGSPTDSHRLSSPAGTLASSLSAVHRDC